MKAALRSVNDNGTVYDCLAFICPGCVEMHGGSGIHLLPINTNKITPSWDWNGNLTAPTLSPSIYTGMLTAKKCHSFLQDGQFKFLNDCTHSMAGQTVEMPDLPDWFVKELTSVVYKCFRCGTTKSSKFWKCCPRHTTEMGPDVVCDTCAKEWHPNNLQDGGSNVYYG